MAEVGHAHGSHPVCLEPSPLGLGAALSSWVPECPSYLGQSQRGDENEDRFTLSRFGCPAAA